ncbi:MAG: site-2 protease family protein [Pseudomonadota bacterium]
MTAEASADDHPWTPLTAQMGDRTYAGEFRVLHGGEVQVRAAAGERSARISAWDHATNLAERLLVAIHEPGLPNVAAPPRPPEPMLGGPRRSEPIVDAPPDNRVGMGLLAAFALFGLGLARAPDALGGVLTFGFVLTGWVLAVMAHEFAHAGVAWLAGDHTVKAKGYLSFDPRRYGDISTSLAIPLLALALGGIGFPGGAVYLRNDLMRSPAWRAAASLAGPGATLVVLLALALVLNLWLAVAPPGRLFAAIAMLAFLQSTALILNLLPLPGLDGFNAIRPFMPKAWLPSVAKAERFALLILLGAVFLVPGFSSGLFGAAVSLTSLLGIPGQAIGIAWEDFHFWKASGA